MILSLPRDLIGRSIFDVIHPVSRRIWKKSLQKLTADPEMPLPVEAEKSFRLDGTITTVEVFAMNSDDGVFQYSTGSILGNCTRPWSDRYFH